MKVTVTIDGYQGTIVVTHEMVESYSNTTDLLTIWSMERNDLNDFVRVKNVYVIRNVLGWEVEHDSTREQRGPAAAASVA